MGFAVPVDTVNRVVPQIIAHGRYSPPTLDIETDDSLSRAVARELGVQGVAVLRGAAPFRGARMGARNLIVPGDVIVSVEGKAVGISLPQTVVLGQLLMAPAERADVIVDFSGLAVGTKVMSGAGATSILPTPAQ